MNVVKAVFLHENKHRFSGQVLIDGKEESCYIASSSHLKNIILLENKEILLIPVKSKKSKFRYALYAVKDLDDFIIVNMNISNEIVRKELYTSKFSFLGNRENSKNEFQLENYKCDLYLPNRKTIIEIKSLISTEEEALFPIMFSNRFDNQLNKISDLLKKNYCVWLLIISYGKETKKIYFDSNNKSWPVFEKCLNTGLKLKALNCVLSDKFEPQLIDKEIEISDLIIK